MIPRQSPRIDVIEQLASDALEAIEESGVINLTAGEVMSTCFTITKRVAKIMLAVDDADDRQHNTRVITDAIIDLYSLIPKEVVH